MTALEAAVIGLAMFAGWLLLLVIAAAIARAIGAERLARWLHLPEGGYE